MSKLSDRLREQGCGQVGDEAADTLDAMETALGGAWYFISGFDRDGAPNLLAEIKAALAKLEGK